MPTPFPSIKEVLEAIQDEGIPDKKKPSKLVYVELRNLAKAIYPALAENREEFGDLQFPSNPSRVYDSIEGVLILWRKHVDTSRVRPDLRKLLEEELPEGKRLPLMMYYITNEADGGIQVLKMHLKEKFQKDANIRNANRTANDALRVAGILLLPENRNAFSGVPKQKNRVKCDQPVSTMVAFSEKLETDFNDTSVVISHPQKLELLQGFEHYDPNDVDRMCVVGRDAAWVWNTWIGYIKPKYAKALMNWHKRTGNGGGQSEDFQNYCGTHAWLGWIYLKDEESGFLLSSCSDHFVPQNLSNESGFLDKGSDSEDVGDDCGDKKLKKPTKAERRANTTFSDAVSKLNAAKEDSTVFLSKIQESMALVQKRMVEEETPISKHMKRMKKLDERYEECNERYGRLVSTNDLQKLLRGIDAERAKIMQEIVAIQSNRFSPGDSTSLVDLESGSDSE